MSRNSFHSTPTNQTPSSPSSNKESSPYYGSQVTKFNDLDSDMKYIKSPIHSPTNGGEESRDDESPRSSSRHSSPTKSRRKKKLKGKRFKKKKSLETPFFHFPDEDSFDSDDDKHSTDINVHERFENGILLSDDIQTSTNSSKSNGKPPPFLSEERKENPDSPFFHFPDEETFESGRNLWVVKSTSEEEQNGGQTSKRSHPTKSGGESNLKVYSSGDTSFNTPKTRTNDNDKVDSESEFSSSDVFAGFGTLQEGANVDVGDVFNRFLSERKAIEQSQPSPEVSRGADALNQTESHTPSPHFSPFSLDEYISQLSTTENTQPPSNTYDVSTDSHLLKSRGLLIVDPAKNGEKVSLEDDHSLTNKDLLIMHETTGNDEVADDSSAMSSLTEVTYETRQDKLRLAIENLKRAAISIPESQPCCGSIDPAIISSVFERKTASAVKNRSEAPLKEAGTNEVKGQKTAEDMGQEKADETKDRTSTHAIKEGANKEGANKERGARESLTDDAALFLRSVLALSNCNATNVDYGSFDEKIIVCITRTYIATQEEINKDTLLREKSNRNCQPSLNSRSTPANIRNINHQCKLSGLRCTWNEPKLSHDLGVTFLEGLDGKAYVESVVEQSTADRSGVTVGDVVSFAVPLNSTFQGYERACSLVCRLEKIGMRTSYRELFDMFLSKTSAGWPVSIVFRRKSEAMMRYDRILCGFPSFHMLIDCCKASDFLHELVTKSREYDFQREIKDSFEFIRGNIEYFMQRPKSRIYSNSCSTSDGSWNAMTKSLFQWNRKDAVPLIPAIHRTSCLEQDITFSNIMRAPLLNLFMLNAVGIFFIRSPTSMAGSGVVVSRLPNGSWSAPSAVCANISTDEFQMHFESFEYVIFVHSVIKMNEFQRQEKVHLCCSDADYDNFVSSKDMERREDIVCLGKRKESFFGIASVDCTIHSRVDISNKTFQVKNKTLSTEDILRGNIPPPKEAAGFYGALRRMEYPSTMYPHPSPPHNLEKYATSDWNLLSSCRPSSDVDSSLHDDKRLSLRDLLNYLEDIGLEEDKREFDIFIQKFKIFLFDGVSIENVIPVMERPENTSVYNEGGRTRINIQTSEENTKGILRLHMCPGLPLKTAELHFIKGNPTHALLSEVVTSENDAFSRNVAKSNFKLTTITKLDIDSIIRVTQSRPKSLELSPRGKENKNKVGKRFISIESRDGKKHMFFARTPKDALLLLCGLKIILEKVLQQK